MMTKVDKDGSGAIDQDEFMALMAEQIENRDQQLELQKVFRIYDDDDNGLISNENLMRCSKDLEEPVTHQEVGEMIRMADLDRKGGVDRDDFMNLMKELGLWGKEREKTRQEKFQEQEMDLIASHNLNGIGL